MKRRPADHRVEPAGLQGDVAGLAAAAAAPDHRRGLDSLLRALRKDDVLVVWKLDRLGRNLAQLVNTVPHRPSTSSHSTA